MSAGRTTRSARPPRPPVRRRARRGEGDLLREEILQATTELLLECGSADRVSTRAVAQRVGCSSPALYLHFPDKAALIYAVCERQFMELGTLVDRALAGIDDPAARLAAAGRVYIRFALDHPEQYRIMMMDEDYGLSFQPSLEEITAMAGMTSVVQAIRDGIDRGMFVPHDPMNAAIAMWAAIHGLVSLHLAKPGVPLPPLEDLIDEIAHVMTNGMLVRPDAPGQEPV